ncbi:MAG: RluA family pseudouridine synthase [Clostridia bacterium]|nr:RluA family pseudouridine synthase [Clostridia bacterium]
MDFKDITILYEDNHLLVVIKPQGVPSQSDKSGDEDMLSLLKAYIKDKYAKPGNVYLGLVHRLDRPTGGVMVFAKTSKAAARLSEQIKDGTFSKRYLAVLTAKPQAKRDRLTHYLAKDQANNIVKVVPMTTDGAKKAVLDYNILEDNDEEGLHLADVKLYTGRSHQIRVQMATIGCPLFGDVKYGKNQPTGMFSLWAYDLSFKHPTTDKIMSFRVFPPEKYPWQLFNLERYIGIVKPRD